MAVLLMGLATAGCSGRDSEKSPAARSEVSKDNQSPVITSQGTSHLGGLESGKVHGVFRTDLGPQGPGGIYHALNGNYCWISSAEHAANMGVNLSSVESRSLAGLNFLGVCPGAPGSYFSDAQAKWEAFRASDGPLKPDALYFKPVGGSSFCHLTSLGEISKRNLILSEIAWNSTQGLMFSGPCPEPARATAPLPRLTGLKSRSLILSSPGVQSSQYSPTLFREPGNVGEHLFWCKNVYSDPQDRVWVAFKPNFIATEMFSMMAEAVRGSLNEKNDLSCSPTVFKSQKSGTYHMYYVTADRRFPLKLYMYHATNTSLVTPWKVEGLVRGLPAEFPGPGEMEAPSAFQSDGKVYLYYALSGRVVRHVSLDDGQSFGPAEEIKGLPSALPFARVIYSNGYYYAVFCRNARGEYFSPPEYVGLMASTDGVHFQDIGASSILQPSGSGKGAWDGGRLFHPSVFVDGNELRIYYAGNEGNYEHWMQNSGIGVAVYGLALP